MFDDTINTFDEESYYFDMSAYDLSNISLHEKNDKTSCYFSGLGFNFYGFKLTNKPKINTYISFTFYRSSNTNKYIPRPSFFKLDRSLNEKEQYARQKVNVSLSNSQEAENFWKVIGFLNQYKELVDLGEFENSYSVISKTKYFIEFNDKETAEKIKDLQELIVKANLKDFELEKLLTESRQKNVKAFDFLLKNNESWKGYQKKYTAEIKGAGEESVWHHFLKSNHWILGLNVDIKFLKDLITEADIGIKDTIGKGSPQVDFLGISDYTLLIELKTPNTLIFKDSKGNTSRAGTWAFSQDFIDGVSQCLAQKSKWQESHLLKRIVKDNEIVDQERHRTVDPKAIFIIGDRSREMPENSRNPDIILKRDTFESFRRNNRNLDIVTYDELYERAYYIVNNKRLEPQSA